MDYEAILNDIKPTKEEQDDIDAMSDKLVSFLNETCEKEEIDAKIAVVGSVAKHTALKGKSDIDIFMAFPLSVSEEELKDTGLKLAHKCSDEFDGDASHHFASHPYVTTIIEDYEVDLVPCYSIEDGSQLKSAVDRTILHTRYVKANLTPEGADEVLLLKKFMDMTGTYGSEFKVGGFAGYLCELLIIKYGSFEETLRQASEWKYGHVIDLEDYGTAKNFKDPLVVIDPTDKNRNVGAALTLTKYAEFIQSARNYLSSDNKKDYFYPLTKKLDKDHILDEFEKRGGDLIAIKFSMPDMPLDTLYPQLKVTTESLVEKLTDAEFNVFDYGYWSDEESECIILLVMASSKLNNVKVNIGPKVFIKKACDNFTNKYGAENCYILNDFLVHNQKREFADAIDYISYIFTTEHIGLIKVGKNLKKTIINSYEFIDIADIDLEFLDDFLNPGQYISR
ncbi:CCA tRNA nucleotidyltransferase [Methanobrevibacter sp.]|uniref:CCA tRNA nucleotidyltransferase n=1 Tax=Methanobrevibacter sp. TaxID=66852 RepID=UPI00386BE461